MIRKVDLKTIQEVVRGFNIEGDISFDDETSLLFHGFKDCMVAAHLDVSATTFAMIAKKTGHPAFKSRGSREIKVNDIIIVHEGLHLGRTMVDGVYVYPLEDIKTRLSIKGDHRSFVLPSPEETKVHVSEDKVIKTFENLTVEQAEFELRCKVADWYYSYSDDNSVWRRGKAQCEGLQKEAEVNGGVHLDIYKYYSTR